MFPENGGDYRTYVQQLSKLTEPLQNLSARKNVNVIWMLNQEINDKATIPSEYVRVPITVHDIKTRRFNFYAQKAFSR